MIKSSNKKHFKKDIHILKIQGSSKYCKRHGNSNCEDCYIFGTMCTNKKFYKKLIFKKRRVSCHNLFLPGKRKPTRYLTLQEDHNISICSIFLFWASGPKYGNQQKDKILSLFLPNFNWQYGMV